jgi:autotransporter-associated beta strand protein
MRRLLVLAVELIVGIGAVASLNAQTLYWDIDGATPGAGGAAPAGVWDNGTTLNWTTDSTGSIATQGWVVDGDAVFSAGTDATGSYTVTIADLPQIKSLTVEEGGTILQGGNLTFGTNPGVISVAAGATWNNSGAGSGDIAGTAGLTKTGAGVLKLGSAETFSSAAGAQLTINEGVADFSGELGLGAVPAANRAGAVTINGGTLRYVGTAGLLLNNTRGIAIGPNGGTIEVPAMASIGGLSTGSGGSAATSFTGSGILTKTGTGRFTLNVSQNAFTGKYRILGGLLNIPGDGRLGPVPAAVVPDYLYMDGGGLRIAITSPVALSANRGITLGPGGGKLIQPGAGTNTLTVNSVIAGTAGGGLIVDWQDNASAAPGSTGGSAGGIVLFTAVNTYDGPTTVNPNTSLRLDGDATIGTGQLNLAGGTFGTTANRSVSANPVPNAINMTANSVINTTSAATTVNLNLSSDSINGTAGTLTFRNDGADAADDVFDPRFSGSGFNFARPIVIDNGAVGKTRLSSFNVQGTTQTFSGVISGNGVYNRSVGTSGNGGETIFTEANTYTGGTTINAGRLTVNNVTGSGTGTGPVDANGGGTLAGTGSSDGLITVNNFGSFSPGPSTGTGTYTASGGLTVKAAANVGEPGGILNFDLAAPGTSDLINVLPNDGLIIDGGTVNLFDAGGLAIGDYTLIDYAGTLGGLGSLTLGAKPSGFSYALQNDVTNTAIVLHVTAGGALQGDYNLDGKVDAADYVVWRKDPAAHGGDPAGYNTWRANFGTGGGSGAGSGSLGTGTVPEPTAAILLLVGLGLMKPWRARRA